MFFVTPPEVAIAKIQARQRIRELGFFMLLARLIIAAARKGLDRRRIARVLHALATAMETVGDK
jgi:hypothetical protein